MPISVVHHHHHPAYHCSSTVTRSQQIKKPQFKWSTAALFSLYKALFIIIDCNKTPNCYRSSANVNSSTCLLPSSRPVFLLLVFCSVTVMSRAQADTMHLQEHQASSSPPSSSSSFTFSSLPLSLHSGRISDNPLLSFSSTMLNVFNEKDITDMLNQSTRLAHLSDDTLDCLLAQANSNGCRLCYDRLFGRFRLVDRVFGRFTDLLQVSLNCQPTNQDQFSPVTTCKDCQIWYKRWLLVTFSGIWRRPPCPLWCHLVELACPHMSVRRRSDYAGLPSFRCTDPISAAKLDDESNSDCINPCDVIADWPGIPSSSFCNNRKTLHPMTLLSREQSAGKETTPSSGVRNKSNLLTMLIAILCSQVLKEAMAQRLLSTPTDEIHLIGVG
ncbi:hypothetical protein T09_6630 [Trichinella sp. T9]|uniref:Transmembrane protein n=1 Tax=Trichinella murrelli TaxID=144512 RepID=A0A0V0TL01_9BILA|nr:hypothetical protein T05_7625 [Trichinella murrelli]KRX64281.1 hypothetical protein T09_6630 [Trichinella sp. T9]